jgi:hypothetical protein
MHQLLDACLRVEGAGGQPLRPGHGRGEGLAVRHHAVDHAERMQSLRRAHAAVEQQLQRHLRRQRARQ